jgi:hypothetical protein
MLNFQIMLLRERRNVKLSDGGGWSLLNTDEHRWARIRTDLGTEYDVILNAVKDLSNAECGVRIAESDSSLALRMTFPNTCTLTIHGVSNLLFHPCTSVQICVHLWSIPKRIEFDHRVPVRL